MILNDGAGACSIGAISDMRVLGLEKDKCVWKTIRFVARYARMYVRARVGAKHDRDGLPVSLDDQLVILGAAVDQHALVRRWRSISASLAWCPVIPG
jgi:hypothetical protein